MVQHYRRAVNVGLMEPRVQVKIELRLAVVYDHGRGLYAEVPADLTTLTHVRTELVDRRDSLEHFRVSILKRQVELHVLKRNIVRSTDWPFHMIVHVQHV